MSGDFVLRPRWPQGLALDPEGSGGGGSGGLCWDGWLPHGHIRAIAKGLNCIFCSETGGKPITKTGSECTKQGICTESHTTNPTDSTGFL